MCGVVGREGGGEKVSSEQRFLVLFQEGPSRPRGRERGTGRGERGAVARG